MLYPADKQILQQPFIFFPISLTSQQPYGKALLLRYVYLHKDYFEVQNG